MIWHTDDDGESDADEHDGDGESSGHAVDGVVDRVCDVWIESDG